MPVKCKKMGEKYRIVGPDGKVEKNKEGSAVDGGGHESMDACQKQAGAINSNIRHEHWNPRKWDGESTVPASALWFRDQGGTVELEAGDAPGFKMNAYTGAPMEHPFFGTVIIDSAGVKLGKEGKKTIILREHARDRVVGFGYAYATKGGSIKVKKGVFSQHSEDGREVAGLLSEGMPLECSINIDNAKIVDLPAGKVKEVNGRTVKGPAVIFAKSRLREVSFCSLGMDAGTSGSIAAAEGEQVEIELVEDKEKEMAEDTKPVEAPDLEKLAADAKEEGKKELVAHFDALSAEFDQDFAVEMFKAGKSLDEAKLLHYEKVKEELAALKAAKPEAVPPKEEKPKDLKATAEAILKARNAAGENLTLGQAMKLALKELGKDSDK
jgi:hypothetical protein